jgi:hypothetical protein
MISEPPVFVYAILMMAVPFLSEAPYLYIVVTTKSILKVPSLRGFMIYTTTTTTTIVVISLSLFIFTFLVTI